MTIFDDVKPLMKDTEKLQKAFFVKEWLTCGTIYQILQIFPL